MRRKRRGGPSRYLYRFAPLGAFTGLGAVAVSAESWPLVVLLGIGAFASARRLLDREGNARKELLGRARENVRELSRVAREDRIAAPQMKRLAALQEGLLQSWETLPEEYGPLLAEDLDTIVDEVGAAALLARRRAALRRHLDGVDRRAIIARIRDLEGEIRTIQDDSALRASFEAALEGRRGELAACDGMPRAIGAVNAQLESIESMLGNLRGDLLSLDPGLSPYALESGLVSIKERVAYFRRSLDEINRGLDEMGPTDELTERLTAR
ncbi:MAG TPA: hypothetical protein VKA51_13725 [Rubrobacteraceae bacterium]|nr:hypothetical protein [Rubrobacteraceae bacterium]